jgi:hypothetical protein
VALSPDGRRLVVRSASPGAGDDGQLFHERLLGLQHDRGSPATLSCSKVPQRRRLDELSGIQGTARG